MAEEPRRLPADAPNIVIVMFDDAGFGQPSAFGGDIQTPTLARLAQQGIAYNAFHSTAMCSPTRAALLTGRNHHRVGAGQIAEFANVWDGYTGVIPKSSATMPEVLHNYGYATAAFGKWHNTPVDAVANGPYDRFPTGHGFDYFYDMSPEQALGERHLDARSDVYALGCVLDEMLVGEPPFTGPTAQAIIARVMNSAPEPATALRKAVPDEVADAILTALEKLPADRFASAAEFASALAGNPAAPARRSGGRASAIAGPMRFVWPAAFALAAGAAGWGWHRPDPEGSLWVFGGNRVHDGLLGAAALLLLRLAAARR